MKSLTIASLVWGLYALWLPNYCIEGTIVSISGCTVEHPIPGIAKLRRLDVKDGVITGSELEVQQKIESGTGPVHVLISEKDGDTLLEQTIDICSMSSNDLFKAYFVGFQQAEFNEGQCPINPGIFTSSEFKLEIDDAPEGSYVGHIEMKEGPNTIVDILCEAEIKS